MLKKAERIPRDEFDSVFRDARVLHSPHFLVRIAPGRAAVSRASVVAGKRALAGAVRRHRLRRRVYEILRGISRGRQFPIDVIVIAKRGTGALSFVDIQNEIRGVLIR